MTQINLTPEQYDSNARTIVARITGYIQATLRHQGDLNSVANYLAELHREFPCSPNWSTDSANELENLIKTHKNEQSNAN